MAEQEKEREASKAFDPMESFRVLRDTYLDSMARTMVEAVNTEAYAQATGAMLEGYFSATAPMREALEKSMTQALQQLSLPSRQEVAALAERFTNVEMRLDDLDAKLDRLLQAAERNFAVPNGAEPQAARSGEAQSGTKPTGTVATAPSQVHPDVAHQRRGQSAQR